MMATLISLDNQRIWAPSMQMSANRSFSKPPFCKQQEMSRQDTTDGLSQDGYVPPKRATSHCQVASNDVIMISSDEESDTDDGVDDVNDTLQSSGPRESHSSIAGSDASGELAESYYGRTDEHPPQLLGTTVDRTITSPADEQGPVQTKVIGPAPSSSMADDSRVTLISQSFTVPQIPVCSDELAPQPIESDDEICPSYQLETRVANLSNYGNLVDNSDNAYASANIRQGRKSSPMLVQSGAELFDDATARIPIQGGKLSNAPGDDARDFSSSIYRGHHTVESEAQCPDEAHIDATIMDDREGRPIFPNPCGGSNKRRRRKAREPGDRGSDSDDEFIPTRKLRKASSHRHKQNPSYYRKSKRSVIKRRARDREKISHASRDENLDTTIASYEEWLLSDAVLKCIRDNGTMTFQMQFTHTPSPCGIHAKHPQPLKRTDHSRSQAVKPRGHGLLNENSLTLEQGVLPASSSDSEDEDTDIYKAELLARWGKNTFLRWDVDGSTGWEPRRNILDKKMLHNFESNYDGFGEGVDVLDIRETTRDKRKYLLHFHGRPAGEDSWVDEKLLSPSLLVKVRKSGLDTIST